MKLPLFSFPLFFLSLLAAPAHAMQANGCEDFKPPLVIVNPIITSPRYDTTQNLATLRAMGQAEEQGRFSGTNHEVPVGLTASSIKLNSKYEVVTRMTEGDRMVCAQIGKFTLDFGFNDTTVYLARELPYNSCSYQTVLGHELQHVAIDNALVRLFADQFPVMLKKAITQIGTIRATSAATAEQRISETITNYMRELSSNLSAVRQSQQAKLDTKEEYSRLSKSCNGTLAELIGKYSR